MSFPSKAIGTVAAWMGVGLSNPIACTAWREGSSVRINVECVVHLAAACGACMVLWRDKE